MTVTVVLISVLAIAGAAGAYVIAFALYGDDDS